GQLDLGDLEAFEDLLADLVDVFVPVPELGANEWWQDSLLKERHNGRETVATDGGERVVDGGVLAAGGDGQPEKLGVVGDHVDRVTFHRRRRQINEAGVWSAADHPVEIDPMVDDAALVQPVELFPQLTS